MTVLVDESDSEKPQLNAGHVSEISAYMCSPVLIDPHVWKLEC